MSYTNRLRDMGDELVKVLKDYANNEIVNKSLSNGLENLSTTLTAIEEYRNCEVQRLEAKVNRTKHNHYLYLRYIVI